MAVVHVKAPADLDPHIIEAELTRAISTNRKRPMTAELTLVEEIRTPSRLGNRRHGFVAILSLHGDALPADLERRLQKVARKALRRCFGQEVSATVKVGMSAAEACACWCSVRGKPQRPA
jgi:hypothetical protein